jgi:hypothetical protein
MDGQMAKILTPEPTDEPVENLGDFLRIVRRWQEQRASQGDQDGFLSQLWYRGVNQHFEYEVPGVYRDNFSERASRIKKRKGLEDKRLELEREVLSQFRTAGAAFLEDRESMVDVYFAAQHFGMPTRLLDWSTNPLAGLYFACQGPPSASGFVYAMDARKVIPSNAKQWKDAPLYQNVMTKRHKFVEYAVGLSFWKDPQEGYHSHILPVRPDIIPGRIGHQSSCFTLHMHGAQTVKNDTMIAITVAGDRKPNICAELLSLNINSFTMFNDLDHLSREIKRSWGLSS